MAFLATLWLPIVLSAVFVFVVSSIIHMVFQYHKNDFSQLPSEDAAADALRKFEIPAGDYHIPYAGSFKAMQSPEYQKKLERGPIAIMTVLPNGKSSMGKSLFQWFIFSIIVSIFAAYIADRALGPTTDYLKVFRFVGCSAFMGYSLALAQNSIWYSRKCTSTMLSMFDGLVYALVTAGVFGWLWPR